MGGTMAGREAGVTGGLGALGLLVAQWLSLAGCSGLHLLGRSGRADTPALLGLLTSQVAITASQQHVPQAGVDFTPWTSRSFLQAP